MTANVSRIKIKNMHKRTFHILMHFCRIEDVGTYIHKLGLAFMLMHKL